MVFESSNGNKVFLKGHQAHVSECVVSSNSAFAVSVSADRSLRLWDLRENRELAVLVLAGPLTSVSLTPDENGVLVGDAIGNLYWIQIEGLAL